jgi:hypothetical protein
MFEEWDIDAHSSGVKPARSLRSAPAQKLLSTSLAMMSALVGLFMSGPAAPPYVDEGGTSEPSSAYSEEIEST